jgi:hypothetical protein
MNRAINQTQQRKSITTDTLKPNSNNSDKDTNSAHTPLLEWSNLKYGLFMTAVIVIPPLIPGASIRLLIMGYMFTIVGIYAYLAVAVAMRKNKPLKSSKNRMRRSDYR